MPRGNGLYIVVFSTMCLYVAIDIVTAVRLLLLLRQCDVVVPSANDVVSRRRCCTYTLTRGEAGKRHTLLVCYDDEIGLMKATKGSVLSGALRALALGVCITQEYASPRQRSPIPSRRRSGYFHSAPVLLLACLSPVFQASFFVKRYTPSTSTTVAMDSIDKPHRQGRHRQSI